MLVVSLLFRIYSKGLTASVPPMQQLVKQVLSFFFFIFVFFLYTVASVNGGNVLGDSVQAFFSERYISREKRGIHAAESHQIKEHSL